MTGPRPRPENWEEIEANRFAVELLLPRDWILRDVPPGTTVDLLAEDCLVDLAEKYQVTVQLMVWRLRDLGLLKMSKDRLTQIQNSSERPGLEEDLKVALADLVREV